jgi:hypothetical protein
MASRAEVVTRPAREVPQVHAAGRLLLLTILVLTVIAGVAASTWFFLEISGTLDHLPPLGSLLHG